MKKLALLISAIVLLAFITSCGDDEPTGPTPTVEFEIDKPFAEVDDEVTFTNNTIDGASFSWDFGDGENSSLENPTHEYDEIGEYTVTLTATGSGGISSTSTETIVVGNRVLAGFDLIAVGQQDTNGNDWDDDGTTADVVVFFGKTSETTISTVPMELDVPEADYPYGVNIAGQSLSFTDEDWVIGFIDNDEPFNMLTDEDSEVMFIANVNPTELGAVDNTTGDGAFLLRDEDGVFQLNIRFRIQL